MSAVSDGAIGYIGSCSSIERIGMIIVLLYQNRKLSKLNMMASIEIPVLVEIKNNLKVLTL